MKVAYIVSAHGTMSQTLFHKGSFERANEVLFSRLLLKIPWIQQYHNRSGTGAEAIEILMIVNHNPSKYTVKGVFPNKEELTMTRLKLSLPILAFVTLSGLLALTFAIRLAYAVGNETATGTFDDHDVDYTLKVINAEYRPLPNETKSRHRIELDNNESVNKHVGWEWKHHWLTDGRNDTEWKVVGTATAPANQTWIKESIRKVSAADKQAGYQDTLSTYTKVWISDTNGQDINSEKTPTNNEPFTVQ